MSLENVREFSNNGKYFAFINNQGKFIVYDIELNNVLQVYTPNLHLSVPCTCFTWIEIGQQSQKSKSKKLNTGQDGQLFVAFGTSKGGVALYSLSSAKIERTFKGDGHSSAVTCIYTDKTDSLFTAGVDGKVIEWSISRSKQKAGFKVGVEKLTCLTVVGDAKFITGAKQLKLWEDDEVVNTFTGHTSNTILLKNVKDGNDVYAISASQLDRSLSMWSVDDEQKLPMASFTMDDAVEYLSAKIVASKLFILAVSRSGVVHYFIQKLSKIKATKPVKAKHTFEFASDSTSTKAVERIPIFSATLDFSLNEEEILIGYGTEQSLRFERIPIDPSTKNNVLVRECPRGFTKKEDIQTDQSFKKKTPIVDHAKVEYLDNVMASKKALKTVEIPMEARLENLTLAADPSGKKPHAKNMAQLLIQGLHSRDASILKLVFGKCDEESIKVTLQKLPPQYVSALLCEISQLMQQKTERVVTAVVWLKFLIQIHASQLMALGSQNFLANFGTCLGIIEYRVEHLKPLSKLSGRLDLLVNQIDRNKMADEENYQNLLVYQEEDSDVDSVIDKDDGHSSSEERWEESADESDTGLKSGDEEEMDMSD